MIISGEGMYDHDISPWITSKAVCTYITYIPSDGLGCSSIDWMADLINRYGCMDVQHIYVYSPPQVWASTHIILTLPTLK